MSRPKQQDSKPKVPGYIVTFSDMVTLLLTFFVMLLSLAQTQEKELFKQGQASFLQAVEQLGLGMLVGKQGQADYDHIQIKHYADSAQSIDQDVPEITEQQIQQLLERLQSQMTSRPSSIVSRGTNYSATAVHFGRDSAVLSSECRFSLREFSQNLQHSAQGDKQIFVLGLARDVDRLQRQMQLSAQRAQAVADYLQATLGDELQWPVYAWGAGSGGQWTGPNSPAGENSQILIAVLRQ